MTAVDTLDHVNMYVTAWIKTQSQLASYAIMLRRGRAQVRPMLEADRDEFLDSIGHRIADANDRKDTHDLHATILHLLGLDHEKLTYTYAGREFRLTDVHGKVAKKILA